MAMIGTRGQSAVGCESRDIELDYVIKYILHFPDSLDFQNICCPTGIWPRTLARNSMTLLDKTQQKLS
jgi:hypothetical protein